MYPSEIQLKRTEDTEQFSATAYPDGHVNGNQMYSIGRGHQIQPDEDYLLSATWTEAEADRQFRIDVQNVVDVINAKTSGNINQNQFDAFFDYGYNCGVGRLAKLIDIFNTQGVYACATAMLKPNTSSGVYRQDLADRRDENIATFWGSDRQSSNGGLITILMFIAVGFGIYVYINNGKIPFIS